MRFKFRNTTVQQFKLQALEADAKARKATRRVTQIVESEITESETTEESESECEAGVFRYRNLDTGYFERKAIEARGRPRKGKERVVETGDKVGAGIAAEDTAEVMPRKSNVSQVTAATGDEGTPVKDRDGINIEDLSLPRTMVQRLAKGVLPPNTQIQKDAITAMSKSATVFVNYISHHANNATLSENRRTIAPKDVYEALENTEFASMIPRLEEELKRYVEIQTGKRNEYRKKVKESGPLGRRKSEGGSGEGEAPEKGDREAIEGVEVEGEERGKKRPRVREPKPKPKGLHTTASVFKSVNARATQNKDRTTNGGTSTVSEFTPTNAPSAPAPHTAKDPADQADSELEPENANDTVDDDSTDDDNEEGGMGEEAGDEIDVEVENEDEDDQGDGEDDDSEDEEMQDSEIGDSDREDPHEALGEDDEDEGMGSGTE